MPQAGSLRSPETSRRNWQTRQTEDCEIIDFRASLLVSKQSHFTIGKRRILAKSSNPRIPSRKPRHSSTNSSTQTPQSHARVLLTIDVRAMFVLPVERVTSRAQG